ncbi:hypothetical protein TeGR_g673, partial [Tetraparma gracilis]
LSHPSVITSANPVAYKPEDPLYWCRSFGSRNLTAVAEQQGGSHHLRRGDEGWEEVADVSVPEVAVVTTREQAEVVLEALNSREAREAFHACDTEVMQIDLKSVGPVGHGHLTCFSMYSGPDFDYGFGKGKALFVDCLDESRDLLPLFKGWFEDERYKKVWHNYGFDRHIMFNEGIDCGGFAGDTMHMARLEDSSRAKFGGGGGGYGLEALTEDLLGRRKRPMKEIFGKRKLKKDGTPGAIVELPPVEEMQRRREYRENWIRYAAYDAEGTWLIRDVLQQKLERMPWIKDHTQYDLYEMYLVPFGECLTDMERRGVRVDAADYLKKVEVQAKEDQVRHSRAFRSWAASLIGPDGLALNPSSSQQLGTFLFGGSPNAKTGELSETQRTFKVPRSEIPPEALQAYADAEERDRRRDEEEGVEVEPASPFSEMTAAKLKEYIKERNDDGRPKEMKMKLAGKKDELIARIEEDMMRSPAPPPQADAYESMTLGDLQAVCHTRGLPADGSREELLANIREDSAFARELIDAASPR